MFMVFVDERVDDIGCAVIVGKLSFGIVNLRMGLRDVLVVVIRHSEIQRLSWEVLVVEGCSRTL